MPMGNLDDEKFLIERESLKYDEKIKKSLLREAMYKIKLKGYESISSENSLLVKVFIGYVSEMENINEILMCLVDCLKKDCFREKILDILINKIKHKIAERLSK